MRLGLGPASSFPPFHIAKCINVYVDTLPFRHSHFFYLIPNLAKKSGWWMNGALMKV